jgi:hypothetical protein
MLASAPKPIASFEPNQRGISDDIPRFLLTLTQPELPEACWRPVPLRTALSTGQRHTWLYASPPSGPFSQTTVRMSISSWSGICCKTCWTSSGPTSVILRTTS